MWAKSHKKGYIKFRADVCTRMHLNMYREYSQFTLHRDSLTLVDSTKRTIKCLKTPLACPYTIQLISCEILAIVHGIHTNECSIFTQRAQFILDSAPPSF